MATLQHWRNKRDIVSTISVIIVAGACGIAAGTPLAILGGIGRCARLGAIVKGGVHLQTLGRIDMVVIDKTGTLTFGRPEVQRGVSAPGVSRETILDAAAAADLRSEHPLGKSIVAYDVKCGSLAACPANGSARFYTPSFPTVQVDCSTSPGHLSTIQARSQLN